MGPSVSLACPGPGRLLHVRSFCWFRRGFFDEFGTNVSSEVAGRLCSLQSAGAPQVLSHIHVTSWQCGFLGTRVGKASHPGPVDILGAALSEATPIPSQDFPDTTHFSAAFCRLWPGLLMHLLAHAPRLLLLLAQPQGLPNLLFPSVVPPPPVAGSALFRLVLIIAPSLAVVGVDLAP